MDGSTAQPRSLRLLLECLRLVDVGPPPEGGLTRTAQECGFSRTVAQNAIDLCARTRSAIETYLGRDIWDGLALSQLYGRLESDFGLSPREADRLDAIHLAALLVNLDRMRNPGALTAREVLVNVARLRSEASSMPASPESTPVFLKALSAFRDPEPREASGPIPPQTGAETPKSPSSEATEPTSPQTSKKRPRKRDLGKMERCIGIYAQAIERNETPPTPTEIAKIVGCDPGTASRATARWEAKRKELANRDARGRYRVAD